MPVNSNPMPGRRSKPYSDALRGAFTDARPYPNEEHIEIGYNGYANLSFTDDSLEVVYRDLHGDAVFRESWTAAAGALTQISAP